MVKYYYDVTDESFKRETKQGRPLYVNVIEAQRIANLMELGVTTESIVERVQLINPKAGKYTIRSFIKNYKEGNIDIPEDAPVPTGVFEEMTEESRIDALEKRVEELEKRLAEQPKSNILRRVKQWI